MQPCQKLCYFMGEESETAPHIVVKDRKSSAYFSTSLDSKTSQYAVAFVVGAIQELGYKRILLKSDNEPAIKRLKERVSECLPGVECVPKEALVGDSGANGSAENAVKQVKGHFRTLKTSTEDRYRCKNDAKSCLLAWIPRHCANLMTRFKRYSDGRTAIQRLTGRRWGRRMVVFGERDFWSKLLFRVLVAVPVWNQLLLLLCMLGTMADLVR